MSEHAAQSTPARARSDRSGTSAMFGGAIVSAVGAYLFQFIGGRALGAEVFAPVSVMWTLLFLAFTIFLLPTEQLVIRKLTLGGGTRSSLHGSWPVIVAVVAGASLVATGFALVLNGELLDGDLAYLPAAVLMVVTHALYVLGRGHLAGRGRFVDYGVTVGLDAVGKVTAALVVAIGGFGPIALSWGLALSPLPTLLLRPFRERVAVGVSPMDIGDQLPQSDRRFMAGYLVATAASQTVLAAGPLVVGALGATSAAISVFFVTTTLFRGPMTASYNFIARILPGLTRRAAASDHAGINRLVRRLAYVALLSAGVVAAIAAVLGPPVVALFFGADFRPSPTLASLAAAGVIAGIVGLGTTQVLVGRGDTDRMAISWLVAVAAAAGAIFMVDAEPSIRVAAGFLVGELTALIALTVSALVGHRDKT